MARAMLVVLIALGLASVAAAAPLPRGPAPAPTPDVSAPVAYKDLMLVLVAKDGAAAVIFTGTSADGDEVEFSYRYESADGKKKLSGTGKLFERRLPQGGYDPEGTSLVAGPVKVEWSKGTADRGWVYYAPEVVTVHLANADNFQGRVRKVGRDELVVKELDLRRFMKK